MQKNSQAQDEKKVMADWMSISLDAPKYGVLRSALKLRG